MNLSVVIPVFNEEDNVGPLYKQLVAVLSSCHDVSDYEIVFVDDGSTDASAMRLSSIVDKRLKIVHVGMREGQSAAFERGIKAAVFDTIATLDADLQNDPAELPLMLSLLSSQDADFVQGWRMPRRDPVSKRISSKIANVVRRWILHDTFHDISCSERVFKKGCTKTIEFFPGAHRFLPYLVQEAGYKVVECKVGHHPRQAGKSKYGITNRLIGPIKDLMRLSWNQKRSGRKIRTVSYIAILGYLAAGLFTMNRYGYGGDEQWLMYRGERSYEIIASFFPGHSDPLRATILKNKFWTDPSGIDRWNYHSSLSGDELWNYHPSFYALLNYRLFSRLLSHWGLKDIPAKHFLNLIVAALALISVYHLAAQMLGEEVAMYSVFFLMFFPRFIAYSHYNPKDIPPMAAVIASYLYGYRWLSSSRAIHIVLAGVLLGLAAACNLGSLILLPIFPLMMLLFQKDGINSPIAASRWNHSGVRCATYLISVFLTLFVLWPNLWVEPKQLFLSIRHFTTAWHPVVLLYFGTAYRAASVPWHYYPFFLLACIPVMTWCFILIGGWHIVNCSKERKNAAARFILLAWAALPILVRMNPWVVKYDQIRHIFLSIPPLMILAGMGGKATMDIFRRNTESGHVLRDQILLYSCVLIYLVGQVISIYPYEGEYFNEIFRLSYPKHIEDHFEFPVWLSCYGEVIGWLNQHAEVHAVIRVPYMIYLFNLYDKRGDLRFVNSGVSDYTVATGLDFRVRSEYGRQKPLFEVCRYQSQLAAVFKDAPRENPWPPIQISSHKPKTPLD